MKVECDPDFQCYQELFSDADGDAAEASGDYAEEEEARINKALESWNYRKTNKESVPTTTPESGTRNMKAQEEGGELTPPTNPKKDVVYKVNGEIPKTVNTSQNELKPPITTLFEQQGNSVKNKLTSTILSTGTPSPPSGLVGRQDTCQLTYLPQTLDHLLADRDILVNLKPFSDLYFKIRQYAEANKPIEATAIVYAIKHGILYPRLIHKLFPLEHFETVRFKINSLVSHHILEVKDKNNGFQEQAEILERAILRKSKNYKVFMQSITYYGLTDTALKIVPGLLSDLEKAIPKTVMKEITERKMQTLLNHSEREHKFQESEDIKRVTERINELWKNATLRMKFGKSFDKVLMQRLAEKYGPEAAKNMTTLQYHQARLTILEEMVKEANKRR
ncbi:MAG TPA: hypothetical protein VLO13_02940 [Halomonas sp.]|nr:hypothetical protein [Halomonas sp.]